MSDEPQNGRATLTVIHNDIMALRGEVQTGISEIRGDVRRIDTRVRVLEMEAARDDGKDNAVTAAQSAERAVRSESAVSRRWIIGIAAAVVLSLLSNLITLAGFVK